MVSYFRIAPCVLNMNIVRFQRHVASRKAVPVDMETKKIPVKMPPICTRVAPILKHPDKCLCTVSLPDAVVVDANLTGRRQWIRLQLQPSDADEWLDTLYEHLKVPRGKTLVVSRYRVDFQGKTRVPLRMWSPDMSPLKLQVDKGDVVKCGITELRAYEREGRQCCGELHRDMVMVRKNKKRRRQPVYFSDGE